MGHVFLDWFQLQITNNKQMDSISVIAADFKNSNIVFCFVTAIKELHSLVFPATTETLSYIH